MSPPILLLVAAFLAVTLGGGYIGLRQIDDASNKQVQLTRIGEQIDDLVTSQLVEDVGLRDFIVTHNPNFVQNDLLPADDVDQKAQDLERELYDAGFATETIEFVERLRSTHREWHEHVERPLLDNPERTDAERLRTAGKLDTRAISDDATAVRQAVSEASGNVQALLRRRINATVITSVGVISLIALIALVLGLSRGKAVAALAREQSVVFALQQALRVEGTQLPRTTMAFAYRSATREALVGGDLIDTWRVDGDRGWFLIADVSGKGVEAARHSAFVQYAIRTLAAECDDPGEILTRFNRIFLDTFDEPTIFVVLFLGAFDARTGVMRYASAGHAGSFIRRAGRVEMLEPTGPIIGLSYGESYLVATTALHPGDTVVLATDGLTEARDRDGHMIGDDGVIRMLARDSEPQEICDTLVAEVERRSDGEVTDDLAILAVRIVAVNDPALARPYSTIAAAG